MGVAGSLDWISGRAPVSSLFSVSADDPVSARRRLLARPADAEWAALVDTQVTFAIGLVSTVLFQLLLVLIWRHLINRKYYRAVRAVHPESVRLMELPKPSLGLMLLPPCCWPLCVGPEAPPPRTNTSLPKFTPFPKSLLWPTPLFFTSSVFVTGLTRAASKLLAVQPEGCGSLCISSAIATLGFVGLLLVVAACDLILFFRYHREHVPWKPGARVAGPTELNDPMMRLAANIRLQLTYLAIQLRLTAPSTAATAGAKPGAQAVPALKRAHATARDLLASRGVRDRKSGAWGAPADDTKEPERTERILAQPFAVRRLRHGDALQSREGYLLFRINGSNRIGVAYRVIVLAVNVTFGVLSGIQPLLSPGTAAATAQAALILVMQFGMSFLCCKFLPDADRIISRVASIQFFAEALSTATLLGASLLPYGDSEAQPAEVTSGDTTSAVDRGALHAFLLSAGFWAAIAAMCMPIIQVIEQRLLTPSLLALRTKKGDYLSLGAALYILVMALPRQLYRLKDAMAMAMDTGADDDGGAGPSADAAGEDEVGGHQGGGGGETVTRVMQAGAGVTNLLARGLAAKEAQGKEIAPIAQPSFPKAAQAYVSPRDDDEEEGLTVEDISDHEDGNTIGSSRAYDI